MKILYIWDSDYPWDIRVEKICLSLIDNGHEVFIASRNLNQRPEFEMINGIQIFRLKPITNIKLNYLVSFPAFFNPFWKTFIHGIISNKNIDLIIVRDLPMAIAGILAGKKFNVPLVFDMAEDYVSLIRAIWDRRKFSGLNLIVRNPYFAKFVEKYSFMNADHIMVVVEEAIDVVMKNGGNKDKISVVSNTPPLQILNIKSTKVVRFQKYLMSKFSAIYVGGIQMGRGLQIVIDAIPDIVKIIPNFLFVIVGTGYATNTLKEKIKKLGIEEYVLWVGWVDHKLIYNYINMCNIGLIPHIVNSHKNTTIPNKLFDYMGLGLPVIASDAAPLKRIVEEHKCGLIFKNNDSADLAKSIISIFNHDIGYGENGKKAIQTKYNWDFDQRRLLNVVDKFK